MNKIILIGNGFDLAHGLKTKYRDFIDHFWDKRKQEITNYYTGRGDDYSHIYENDVIVIKSPCKINELPDSVNSNAIGYDWFVGLANSNYRININGNFVYLALEYKNYFLMSISEKNTLQNWVDIEAEYYSALKECSNGKYEGGIEILNNEFLFIKNALEDYLTEILNESYPILPQITSHINTIIDPQKKGLQLNNEIDNNILFVNFNYTTIADYYIDYFTKFYPDIIRKINIHGKLKDRNSQIIFGYGDEIDENYKHIENLNDNRYMDNIKSIKYFDTSNYKNLLDYIEAEEYQLYIMGLSCGISDRTLLNTLFEHKHCLSIKIYYHVKDDGTDNYSDIVRNISRNFPNKALMRNIVADRDNCEALI